MKNSKNKRTTILVIILLGLLVVAYKVVFMPVSDDSGIELENDIASERVEVILEKVRRINFDTNIIDDYRFKSLRGIESPLPFLPVGRKNPFAEFSK